MKKFIIVMMGVVIAITIGLAGVLVLGLTGKWSVNNMFSLKSMAKLANEQVFQTSEIQQIDMEYSFFSVQFIPTSQEEIVLREYMSSWNQKMLATTSTQENVLSIRQGNLGLHIGFWYGYVELLVPESYRGKLTISTKTGSLKTQHSWHNLGDVQLTSSSGSVRIEDLDSTGDVVLSSKSGSVSAGVIQANGNVKLNSSSGSVRLKSLKAAEIFAESSSGSVKMEQATADFIKLKSSSGNIKVERLDGRFDLQSSSGSVKIADGTGSGKACSNSGSVEIELRELAGNLEGTSSSGSVRLYLPENTSFQFCGETSSGSIRTPINDQLSFDSRGKKATGSHGQHPEYEIYCKARSGSVVLEWI